ncbi:MAG: hypothetical protein ACREHF_15105, partial [Rhizomicrobium sp.]
MEEAIGYIKEDKHTPQSDRIIAISLGAHLERIPLTLKHIRREQKSLRRLRTATDARTGRCAGVGHLRFVR